MRITGGRWRSRRLKGPKRNSPIRPTPDALRERAFQILGDGVVDAACLDLFSGTGSVGIEALSRGASRAVFVDEHPSAIRLIQGNLAGFAEADGRTVVIRAAADAAVRRLARSNAVFDLLWADPPFPQWEVGLAAVVLAFELGVLAPGGTACLEMPDRSNFEPLPDTIAAGRVLSGGTSKLVMLRWALGAEGVTPDR